MLNACDARTSQNFGSTRSLWGTKMQCEVRNYMTSKGCLELADVGQLDNTFVSVVKESKADVVCDIGSRDGEMAIKAKRANPEAQVYAFEPNPENFFEFAEKVVDAGVHFIPLAIGSQNSIEMLKVPSYASKYNNASITRRGIASLKSRVNHKDYIEYVAPQVKLSSFFQIKGHEKKTFAMWIDVEGGSFEVVQGIGPDIIKNTHAIKVEVETMEVWAGQKNYKDVVEFLGELCFYPAYWFFHELQFDIIFLNRRFY
jgi:FkbM family methyltransferase